MKKILLALTAILLVSCGKELSMNQLQERDGKYFEVSNGKEYNGKVTAKYVFSGVKVEGQMKDGLKTGKWKTYYEENGALKSEVEYKEGHIVGTNIVRNENGEVILSENYNKDGNLDGDYKEYYTDGKLEKECSYKNGKLDGLYKKYAHNEKLIEEINYKDGLKDGVEKRYNLDGKLMVEANYKDNKLNGKYIEYRNDGKIGLEANYKNGKLDGQYKKYSMGDNTLEIEANYKDGKLDGMYKSYDYNGNLEKECSYKNGKLDGLYKEYEGAKVKNIKNYKDNKLDGVQTYIKYGGEDRTEEEYKNGKLYRYSEFVKEKKVKEYLYKDDILNGTYFYITGGWKQEGSYKDGMKDGAERVYINGKLNSEKKYENGVQVTE